jgi:Na+-transporting methylmalonyl-CoA/oxaloacetate decarboxylase gamma subunit
MFTVVQAMPAQQTAGMGLVTLLLLILIISQRV